MKKVLLVDDYLDSCHRIVSSLSNDYEVVSFSNVEDLYRYDDFDECVGVLVDVNLPTVTGDIVIKNLRQRVQKAIPFCLITSSDHEETMQNYYSFMIDEFFHKDTTTSIVKYRFETAVERVKNQSHYIEFGPFSVDFPSALVRVNNEDLRLTTTEFKIICHMIIGLRDSDYLDKGNFFEKIWGDTYVEEKTISTHLANLNKKISVFGIKIKTKRFKGLFFEY